MQLLAKSLRRLLSPGPSWRGPMPMRVSRSKRAGWRGTPLMPLIRSTHNLPATNCAVLCQFSIDGMAAAMCKTLRRLGA
jgi:hypothetical protein